MFHRIEARRYKCLRSIGQSINPFEILIGSNASGKSTFLDVVAFLGDLLSFGLEGAVEKRTANFHDLVWGRDGDSFELAVEAVVPEDRRTAAGDELAETIRYEVAIRLDTGTEKLHIDQESVVIHYTDPQAPQFGAGFAAVARSRAVTFSYESRPSRCEQNDPHRNYSSLTSLPSDSDFPTAAWLREYLRTGIRRVSLDPEQLRKPSPPATTDIQDSNGSYLHRAASQLKNRNPEEFKAWLAHVRTVLPEIQDIRTVLIEESRHRYIMLDYQNGVSVPSWMVSDGTLRLLALTILAYASEFRGVYLIEEPENGVHPSALEAIYESLSSVYDGQVLLASHSPVLLSMAKPEQLLCFLKTSEGASIVRGSEHQALRDWRGEVSLGMLAASGILG